MSALSYDKVNALVRDKLLPIMVNNIFDSNVLAGRLLGKAQKHDSTLNIRVPLEYAKNRAQGMIAKYAKMNLAVPEPFTNALYNPITAYQALSIAWEDELEMTSPNAIMNGLTKMMENAEKSMKTMFAEKLYQLASAKATDDIHPLDELISATTDVGGITYSDHSWWVSNVLTSTNFGSTDITDIDVLTDPESKGFLEKIIRLLVSKATFAGEKPTVLPCSRHLFDIMDDIASHTVNRNVAIKKSGAAAEKWISMGFDAMEFRGVPIIPDDELYNSQASDSAGRIYAINENSLKFHVNARGAFVHEPFAKPVGQLTRTSSVLWRGNLGVANRKQQAVVTGLLSEY